MSKKPEEQPHEEHADETWLIPYSDLLTLLLALFIVLFASSSLDKEKMAQIEYAMAAAFGSIPSEEMKGDILNFMEDAKAAGLNPNVGLNSDSRGGVLEITSVILFQEDGTTLKPEGTQILKQIADLLNNKKYHRYQIVIEGHTDDEAPKLSEYQSNWELSAVRAGIVVRELIKQGCSASRFESVGMAEISPKFPNKNVYNEPIPINRQLNNRISIHIEM